MIPRLIRPGWVLTFVHTLRTRREHKPLRRRRYGGITAHRAVEQFLLLAPDQKDRVTYKIGVGHF